MTQMKSILVLNGPNLNMLGTREPELYGTTTLAMIEADCVEKGKELGFDVTCQQSNDEGALVTLIQQAIGTYDAIILNAAAYTHTSVALRDALAMFDGISVEVHISNVYKRDDFRHKSFLAGVVTGVISGFGAASYAAAITAIHEYLGQK